jgi:hypothetical protein
MKTDHSFAKTGSGQTQVQLAKQLVLHRGMPSDMALRAAELLSEAMASATADIEAHIASLAEEEKEANAPHLTNQYLSTLPTDFFVLERRRLLAEGSIALSQVGQRAALQGDAAPAMLALEAILVRETPFF